jgi:hypothetical protein
MNLLWLATAIPMTAYGAFLVIRYERVLRKRDEDPRTRLLQIVVNRYGGGALAIIGIFVIAVELTRTL